MVALWDFMDVKATCLSTNMDGLWKGLAMQSQPMSSWPHLGFMDGAAWLQVDFERFLQRKPWS
jgi:hypothetical protein